MTFRARRLAALTTFLMLAAAPLAAQRVRGTVVREDGTTPAAGIVVVVAGSNDLLAGRALTDAAGVFDVRLPAAGTYHLSALRIGYRPTVVGGVAVADSGVATVRIVLSGAAVSLSAVAVRSADVCGASRDPQNQVVQVWTEARTALAAAALWSREPIDAEWIRYERTLQPGNEFIRSQKVQSARAATTHAFVSWAADSLAARGYGVSRNGEVTYYAPDPEVLLSESFAETHCFHLEPSRAGGEGLIGVGFTPQRGRADRVEIEGTLWIDRASSELRWLEYTYVGLGDAELSVAPGGRVEFVRLPQGPWMISRWHIRMAHLVLQAQLPERGYKITVMKQGQPALRAIAIAGGVIARASRRGQELYASTGSGIALQLVRDDSTVSVAGAQVTLEGTDYAWRADGTGLVLAAPVLDGRYTAQIATEEMLAVGAEPVEHAVTIAASRTRLDSAGVPSAREIVRRACGADAVKEGLGALHGTVRDSLARPAAGRAVTVSWLGDVSVAGGRVRAGRTTIGTMTDERGAWHLCDVPRGRTLAVRSAGDEGRAAADVVVPATRWIGQVALRLGGAADATGAAGDSSAASLEIFVRDAAGTGVGGTALELSALAGEERKLTTDRRGRALVPAFPPGMVKLKVRRAGYMAGEVLFAAAPGRNTVPVILLYASAPTLDTVRVVGNRRASSRLDGFETRRARREATASFTAADIAKRSPFDIADLLRSVNGVRVAERGGVTSALLSRGFRLDRDANEKPCIMRVVLDAVLLPVEAGVNVVRPSEVLGLEVFASTARVPTGIGILATDAACGAIAIWTGQETR